MRRIVLALALLALSACCRGGFTKAETEIIRKSTDVMYVTVENDPQDSIILRTPSKELSKKALRSEDFKMLCDKMLSTVNDPAQDGVGIAAPQVGIDRRVVLVMRYDLPDTPFRVYANLRIESMSETRDTLPEGCLSLPPYRGEVPRSTEVVISYTDLETMERVQETVSGYTARIFQHECDHLEGHLYSDRCDSIFVDEEWALERRKALRTGAYLKPDWMMDLKN